MEGLEKFLNDHREIINWTKFETKYGLSKRAMRNFYQYNYLSKENKTLLINAFEEIKKNISLFSNPNLDCNV